MPGSMACTQENLTAAAPPCLLTVCEMSIYCNRLHPLKHVTKHPAKRLLLGGKLSLQLFCLDQPQRFFPCRYIYRLLERTIYLNLGISPLQGCSRPHMV